VRGLHNHHQGKRAGIKREATEDEEIEQCRHVAGVLKIMAKSGLISFGRNRMMH